MSDVPANVQTPTQPPPAAVTPASVPAPAEVPAPAAQQPISVTDVVTVDGQQVTIGDMRDALRWQNEHKGTLEVYNKAFVDNDPAAIQELMQKHSPLGQPVQQTPEQAEIGELRTQLQSMQSSLSQMQPTMNSVQTAQRTSQMSTHILQNPTKYPRMAANTPVASQMAFTVMKGLETQVRESGADPNAPGMQQALLNRALENLELSFNGGVPPTAAPTLPGVPAVQGVQGVPGTPNPVSHNDQTNPQTPTPNQPLYTVVSGQVYKTSDLQQQNQPLPTAPIAPVSGGSPMGLPANTASVPFGSAELFQRMNERATILEGGLK